MNKTEAKEKILFFIDEAENLVPKDIEPDLPYSKILKGIPEWHKYENEIWKLGEEIRQLLNEHKELYKDKDLFDRIISICLNRNSKRGRQSFIMLLWNKSNAHYAERLIKELDDKFVYGHIIEGLNKMEVSGYSDIVKPFCLDKNTWIRNQSKKYVQHYGS